MRVVRLRSSTEVAAAMASRVMPSAGAPPCSGERVVKTSSSRAAKSTLEPMKAKPMCEIASASSIGAAPKRRPDPSRVGAVVWYAALGAAEMAGAAMPVTMLRHATEAAAGAAAAEGARAIAFVAARAVVRPSVENMLCEESVARLRFLAMTGDFVDRARSEGMGLKAPF